MKHAALLTIVGASLLACSLVGAQMSDDDGRYARQRRYDDANDDDDWTRTRQSSRSRHCQSCNPDECPVPVDCVAGVVKDPCQCCDVCGKAEFELCDHPRVCSLHAFTP